jgi:hypothetical protein
MEGRCVDDCDSIMNREDCRKWEYCRWFFLRYTGDAGRCVWRTSEEYKCSDIKRYSECESGGRMDILLNKCEYNYYKDKCERRCELYSSSSSECEIEGGDECYWLKEDEENNDNNKKKNSKTKINNNDIDNEEKENEEKENEENKRRCILKVCNKNISNILYF